MRPIVSLTFDDGLPCQLTKAIPVLTSLNLKATFFLPTGSDEYPLNVDAWLEHVKAGHEVGSHSVTHVKAATLKPASADYEARQSKAGLEFEFKVPVTSFCYPYTDAPSVIQDPVRKYYKQARGGRGARPNKYLVPRDGANLWNLPCFHVNESTIGEAHDWAAKTVGHNAWLVLMLHGVGEPQAWDNVTVLAFAKMLDTFLHAGVEFRTFAEGADIYRRG